MTDRGREFKEAVYGELARLGKAMASPRRLELLDVLAQAPRTVEGLAREIDQSVANTSQHLQVLRQARVVEADKAGLHVRYRLADPAVADLLVCLRRLGERRIAEIPTLTARFFDGAEPVEADGLRERVRRGDATLIDVRAPDEYAAGHLAGALSVPMDELERRLRELPADRPIVAYCRGPFCVLAARAVERLRAEGFDAARLELGVSEMRARGWVVEVGAEPGA